MPQIIHRKTVHEGLLFDIERLLVPGEDGQEHAFEVLRHPGGVVIVPVLEDGRMLMIRNERVSVGQRLWELPAGKLEPNEDPKLAAGRELEEETGYRAARLKKLGEFFTTPGFCDELLHVYVAEGLERHVQRLDASEDIIVEHIASDEAVRRASAGELKDAKTVAAILMWHVEQLKTHATAGYRPSHPQ